METVIVQGIHTLGGNVLEYLGHIDKPMMTLMIFMAIDWISGMAVAGVYKKSGKTECGALRSDVGFVGVTKKVMVLGIVVVAHLLEGTTGMPYIKDAVIVAYTVIEAVSVIENAGLMGVPIPKVIRDSIEVLKEQTGCEDNEDDDGAIK